MTYIHQGKAMNNGKVDAGKNVTDPGELAIRPEDDGFHIVDYRPGDFEWWYFDLFDSHTFCFLKIVMHLGTDPLKTKIWPQLAVSVNTPEFSESCSVPYRFDQLNADTNQCNVLVGEEVGIWTESGNLPVYVVHIDTGEFQCRLKWTGKTEGWKPLGDKINYRIGRRFSSFSWTIPLPDATAEGHFTYRGKEYVIQDALGYHDHNYYKVASKHPLHLDQLVRKWYWGKFYTEKYTLVFMDTHFVTNRISSFLVIENNKIDHSSNNHIDCEVISRAHDRRLKTTYPESVKLASTGDFPLQLKLEKEKLLDSKDLLGGVNPALKWLIKRLVARPAYHGILAGGWLTIQDKQIEGVGNYESMVFR